MPAVVSLKGPEALTVDDDLRLEHTRGRSDAYDMFNLIDNNRRHLEKSMPEVADFTYDAALKEAELTERLSESGLFSEYWIVDRGTRVGMVDLGIQAHFRVPFLGYWLAENAQGRGLATRSANRLLDFGFGEGGMSTVMMMIRPENAASQRVASRIGGKIIGRCEADWRGTKQSFEVWRVQKDER